MQQGGIGRLNKHSPKADESRRANSAGFQRITLTVADGRIAVSARACIPKVSGKP
jgi:hypothetical protein